MKLNINVERFSFQTLREWRDANNKITKNWYNSLTTSFWFQIQKCFSFQKIDYLFFVIIWIANLKPQFFARIRFYLVEDCSMVVDFVKVVNDVDDHAILQNVVEEELRKFFEYIARCQQTTKIQIWSFAGWALCKSRRNADRIRAQVERGLPSRFPKFHIWVLVGHVIKVFLKCVFLKTYHCFVLGSQFGALGPRANDELPVAERYN